ncbi:MAG: exodeoxyribonuclease VII large subunit [Candidatus Kerfeldbacteria bacterium CG15_BIG_FIL_POST_REV_8_21_14_020_45_12]|uniref:Exodeoxyribonuclease 7 large subunit n=1 Tax=Candidatus Kerfeldbacteria bacterium CG15_BIG_FIL_POST_REV_8_21_14_020_45_12 TaxID=2014247 RepID=A0A2M7H396_9BACT|nr:MAG: exodeoxyribonuclease VII large subunit [Candidatus Kerfeldbacteria bacterium CG15_BIG_FIL_POST_REV_8_21_14_020_45_12]PJA93852.1 MAG: exodeoxyribonuclease VII large subunit [Candidatus Kerfeldbacteria bacterium CG_4_9_14_3_um_filter_45_8]
MHIYSVSEFRDEINELLGQVTVAVQGEISDFRVSQNRFVWFTLVDEDTSVQCFMMAFQLKVSLKDGMEVRLVGSPTTFKKGQYVFRPRQVELVGEGGLKQAYEFLKSKLEQEGLFDESRKRQLPRFPRKIGLITSSDAAAYTDVLRVLKNRWAGLEVLHANVSVQGARAVPSIVKALQQMSEEQKDLNCILLTRGGGSLEDLQAFNSEEIVRAIFACNIPVVSGVGHERDVTLADLVADVRASTPSNAAEIMVPDKRDVTLELAQITDRLERQLREILRRRQDSVASAVDKLDQQTRLQLTQTADLDRRLRIGFERFINSVAVSRERLDHAVQLLQSFNPQEVLKRGYSMVLGVDGKIISGVERLTPGQQVELRFADGTARSTIDETSKK